MQFTASQQYVDLLEEAKDLLAAGLKKISLEEVHLHALRELVVELKKRKCGATTKPRAVPSGDLTRAPAGEPECVPTHAPLPTADRNRNKPRPAPNPPHPRQRGRYIPRAERRKVWERDQGRCTYVDATGHRCRETAGLELDHIHAFAHGGPSIAENLRLRCRAHNALTAESDFGRDFMAEMKRPPSLE